MEQLSINGSAYTLEGPISAPVVVLIHGLGLDHSIWKDIAKILSADFRVLNYDLYWHGSSRHPDQTPSLSVFSRQLAGLLDELEIRVAALVGFSLGGMINRRFAMDHPDRVTALGILNSPHEREQDQQRLVEERASQTASGGPAATIDTTLARWFTPGFLASHPEVVIDIKGRVLANDPTAYAGCRKVLATGVLELIRPEPAIALPALVMTCENDSGSTPKMTRGIAREIAGAVTVIVPALQHLGLIEQPELFSGPVSD